MFPPAESKLKIGSASIALRCIWVYLGVLAEIPARKGGAAMCASFYILRSHLLFCLLLCVGVFTSCQGCPVKPNRHPGTSPDLDVNIFDYVTRTLKDITGPRGQYQNYQYAGLFDSNTLGDTASNFDSNIGVHAHDPGGVRSLSVSYQFYACAEQGNPVLNPLTSFNNGATTGQSGFTITSTPPQQNNGQVTTDLAFPITITWKDLQSVACANGKNSEGNGTIVVTAVAKNFSSNSSSETTQGFFDIRVGNPSPIPNP